MYGGSTVCAVVAPYKVKPERMEDSVAIAESVRSELGQTAGLKEVIDIYDEDGAGYSVAIWESPDARAAAAVKMEEIWARFEGIFEKVEEEEFGGVEYLVP